MSIAFQAFPTFISLIFIFHHYPTLFSYGARKAIASVEDLHPERFVFGLVSFLFLSDISESDLATHPSP